MSANDSAQGKRRHEDNDRREENNPLCRTSFAKRCHTATESKRSAPCDETHEKGQQEAE